MTDTPKRSTFVTVVAWIFIGLSGFATVIAILQNVMVQTVFLGDPEMNRALENPPADMPPIFVFMLHHLGLLFLASLLFTIFVLICSIGLLRRWNWARLCFVAIMLLGIVWSVAGVVFQIAMLSSMQREFQDGFQDMPGAPDMSYFFITIVVVSAVFAIGFSVLYGWIVKRLLSAPVVAEFHRKSYSDPYNQINS